MIGNCFVIDSVVHAYNLTPENQLVQPVSGALSAARRDQVRVG